jgi:hypothetical protein
MAFMQEKEKSDPKQLESLIQHAIKKIGGRKENDLCRYLPGGSGGYIHHFTMRKMKSEQPDELLALISKYIINVDRPATVPPKPRAARGSRKRRDQVFLTKNDIECLIGMARANGNKDMIRKLLPRKDLATIKRELIASIRHGQVDQDLWQSYVDAIINMQSAAAAAAAM